jgi:hypothetical protein
MKKKPTASMTFAALATGQEIAAAVLSDSLNGQ